MTDLIEIQLITSSMIVGILGVALRFKLLQKALQSIGFDEEQFRFLRVIVIMIMLYLTFLIVRDLWKVLR